MKIPQSDPASAMQVNNSPGSPAPVTRGGAGRMNSGSRAGNAAAQVTGDQTSLGSSVVALSAQALSLPEVRADRVQGLQQQIASGSYQPSPTAIADRMLADPLSGLNG